jgi:hypothetical protein
MRTRIHLRTADRRHNRKHGTNRPFFSVKTYKQNRTNVRDAEWTGFTKFIHDQENRFQEMVVAWLETESEVKTYQQPRTLARTTGCPRPPAWEDAVCRSLPGSSRHVSLVC